MQKQVKVENSQTHFINLVGENNFEIGKSHGKQLEKSIKRNIEFYLQTFAQPNEKIEELANIFGENIESFSEDLNQEIEGIAEGAGVPLWQIYMLNARSEIFSTFKFPGKNEGITECTLVFFPEQAVLSENWDWAKQIGEETFVFRIQQKGRPTVLTLSEAGILAKIGLNSGGVGLGMNFLEPAGRLSGVPFHVLIRSALEQENINNAAEVFRKYGNTVSGNVCLIDKTGEYLNFELDGVKVFEMTKSENQGKKYFCHTNHFFKKEDANNVQNIEDSKTSTSARFVQVKDKMSNLENGRQDLSSEFMRNILLDDSNKQFPLLRPYISHPLLADAGTNTFIQLFLKENKIVVAYAFESFENLHSYSV